MEALSAAAIAGRTKTLLAFAVPALLPDCIRLMRFDAPHDPAFAAFVVFWAALLSIVAGIRTKAFARTSASR